VWADLIYWRTLKSNGSRFTLHYLLQAIDLDLQWDGSVERTPPDQRLYINILLRTLWISFVVTLVCILLGYPLAFFIATAPPRRAKILILLVLLPFWTSLLVRTAAWVIVLQKAGVVNDALLFLGLIDEPLTLIFNRTGVYIAMVHILLPFMVLPLYSVMKTIPPSYMRAARSMGATSLTAFRRVYFPQTLAGIGAGSILVFILSIGYYITPALVGGQSGRFITNFIAYHMQQSLNWGLAAAIGSILLGIVVALYMLYNRLVGIDNMKLG